MLLTLTTTREPATDLGFLLRKNPARLQSFNLTFGMVRNRRGPRGEGGALEQYVNDRPYAASSFLSVAIAEVFGSALAGKSKERPELAGTPLPLCVTLS